MANELLENHKLSDHGYFFSGDGKHSADYTDIGPLILSSYLLFFIFRPDDTKWPTNF